MKKLLLGMGLLLVGLICYNTIGYIWFWIGVLGSFFAYLYATKFVVEGITDIVVDEISKKRKEN